MPALDRVRAQAILERLDAIPDDAVPHWGELRKDTLIGHLIWAVEESMQPDEVFPFMGNFVTKYIFAPLLIRGLAPFPKNVKFPGKEGEAATVTTEGTLDDLRNTLDTFLMSYENGELTPPPHPVLGDLGPKGWAYFHVQHFEHHFRQFGA